MQYGKRICAALKQVRKQIAEANGIDYEVTECHHEGNCKGTCPKCEAELRYIENQLVVLRSTGKAASIVGLALGVATTFSSCANIDQAAVDIQPQSEPISEECLVDGEYETEGMPYSDILPPPPPLEDVMGDYDVPVEELMNGLICYDTEPEIDTTEIE